MKFTNVLTLILILTIAFAMQMPQPVSAQQYTSCKYVKTAKDTLRVPGLPGVNRHILITNESDSNYLFVYFANDTGAGITSSIVRIPPGGHWYFDEPTTKVIRYASEDSVYSQCIIGNVTIGSKAVESESLNAAGIISQDKYSEAELTGRKFPLRADSKNENLVTGINYKRRMCISSDLTY